MKERNLIILIVGIILIGLLFFSNMNQFSLNIPDNQVNDSNNNNQEVHQESNTQYTQDTNNNKPVEEVSEDTKNIKPTDSSSKGNNT